MDVDVRVEDDPAHACAELLAESSGVVVLTGGSTPDRAYELAAELRGDWRDTTFWWGDERCVPPDHEWSNYGMAKRALLDRVQLGAVHRIEGELGAAEAATRYAEVLRGQTPGLVLLGLGPDGHVASLYPNAPGLDERDRAVIAAEAKLEPFVDRVTLTLPVLNAAPLVVFLVAGSDKADAVRRAFGEPPSPEVPGSLARSKSGRTIALLDREAASRLAI